MAKNTRGVALQLDLTGGAGCAVNGELISPNVRGKVTCDRTAKACTYQTTLTNFQRFERTASVDEATGEVTVFGKGGAVAFRWQRIGD